MYIPYYLQLKELFMENLISEIPTDVIVSEMERRYPAGFVMAFLTDDPSFNKEGFTEYFKSSGPSSSQRGLSENLVDHIAEANNPMSFGYFDDDDDDDDDDFLND